MKKVLCKVLAATSVAAMMVSTVAFAATISKPTVENNKLTVTVTGLGTEEESTLLAVEKGTALSAISGDTSKIFYIDQVTAKDGTATFTFDVENSKDLDIYSGYSTMTEAAPLNTVYEKGGDTPTPPTPGEDPVPGVDFIYGDVNNDKIIDSLDATDVINFYLRETGFVDINTGEAYKYGIIAGNVDNEGDKPDSLDATAIINRFLYDKELPVNIK